MTWFALKVFFWWSSWYTPLGIQTECQALLLPVAGNPSLVSWCLTFPLSLMVFHSFHLISQHSAKNRMDFELMVI